MSASEWAEAAFQLSLAAIIFSCGAFTIDHLKLNERIVLILLIIFSPFIIDLFS